MLCRNKEIKEQLNVLLIWLKTSFYMSPVKAFHMHYLLQLALLQKNWVWKTLQSLRLYFTLAIPNWEKERSLRCLRKHSVLWNIHQEISYASKKPTYLCVKTHVVYFRWHITKSTCVDLKARNHSSRASIICYTFLEDSISGISVESFSYCTWVLLHSWVHSR